MSSGKQALQAVYFVLAALHRLEKLPEEAVEDYVEQLQICVCSLGGELLTTPVNLVVSESTAWSHG